MWVKSTTEMTNKSHAMYILKNHLNKNAKYHETPSTQSAAAHMF